MIDAAIAEAVAQRDKEWLAALDAEIDRWRHSAVTYGSLTVLRRRMTGGE